MGLRFDISLAEEAHGLPMVYGASAINNVIKLHGKVKRKSWQQHLFCQEPVREVIRLCTMQVRMCR